MVYCHPVWLLNNPGPPLSIHHFKKRFKTDLVSLEELKPLERTHKSNKGFRVEESNREPPRLVMTIECFKSLRQKEDSRPSTIKGVCYFKRCVSKHGLLLEGTHSYSIRH